GGRRVDLPTYAFQRQRYWLAERPRTGRADPGTTDIDHPLLAAMVDIASGDGLLFTGALSPSAQPWLADHTIGGSAVLPGTAFVELAAAAGRHAGCDCVEDLALHVPLVLPADGDVQLQVFLSDPDDAGARTMSVHSRRTDQP